MAWKDWRKEVPKVSVRGGCFDMKRRVPRQEHVLFRLAEPMTVEHATTQEQLDLPEGFLCDGSSVPGALWGALDADPADLLLPGAVHDYAYRKGARWRQSGGESRAIKRYEADLLHIAVCQILRVKKSDRAKIFYALRVGGSFAFRNREVDWDGRD
jgi:hypothetical protein